jgi:hypothetical protein
MMNLLKKESVLDVLSNEKEISHSRVPTHACLFSLIAALAAAVLKQARHPRVRGYPVPDPDPAKNAAT